MKEINEIRTEEEIDEYAERWKKQEALRKKIEIKIDECFKLMRRVLEDITNLIYDDLIQAEGGKKHGTSNTETN